jgi:peptidoglycan/LPS O-acetylase OafA/YrhL
MATNRLLSSYLDFVRFFAALLVVLGHAKLHAFGQGKVSDSVVLVTSAFPHVAVIIFFVISGYLVGGKLYSAGRDGFSAKYLVDRATRIYTVAIPALTVGFLVMAAQRFLYGHAFSLTSDRCVAGAERLFGSLLFLHRGLMPTPCFNGPFWSLIYEVFYYLFFFALAIAIVGKGRAKIFGAIAAIALGIYGVFEPRQLIAYSTIWLLGMAAAQAHPFRGRALWFTLAIVGVFLAQAFLRYDNAEPAFELLAALAMVGSILLLQRWQPFQLPAGLSKAFAFGAGMSYSLYLFHAPALNMTRSIAEDSFGWRLGGLGTPLYWYPAFVLIGLVGSAGFWWLFERHTMAIRSAVERKLKIQTRHQSIPPNEPAADGPPLPSRDATQV